MPLIETTTKQIKIATEPLDVFTSLKQFTYLAEKGTIFVWLEDLSRVQITWGGDQLFEVEARKNPQKNFVDVILGTTPNQVKVPVGEKQELTVGFSGEDLWEWMGFIICWGKPALKDVLTKKEYIPPPTKEELNHCFPESKRRGRREL